MRKLEQERRQEVVIYAVLWGAVFAVVPLVMLFRDGAGFRLGMMLEVWAGILPFFLLFLLHDLAAAPLLVERRRGWAYVAVTLVMMTVFGLYAWRSRPEALPAPPPPERMDRPSEGFPPPERFGNPPHDGRRAPMDPGVMSFVMGLLLIGVNLGVKYYLKSVRGERRMRELQTENLGRQLEALRYQINPHFFMNTLNNIHALVDIEPEKAKESIEEFSKLMRYVLYEGNRPTIPLEKELEFLRHYVALMRMRYADSVRIDLSLPEGAEGAEIPPLMLASFVENAFKHGISYEKPSFVRVTLSVREGKISFKCVNSRQGVEQVRSHGIGLQNVRERLELLYGDRYTLLIDEDTEVYDVLLLLPLSAGLEKEGV